MNAMEYFFFNLMLHSVSSAGAQYALSSSFQHTVLAQRERERERELRRGSESERQEVLLLSSRSDSLPVLSCLFLKFCVVLLFTVGHCETCDRLVSGDC